MLSPYLIISLTLKQAGNDFSPHILIKKNGLCYYGLSLHIKITALFNLDNFKVLVVFQADLLEMIEDFSDVDLVIQVDVNHVA